MIKKLLFTLFLLISVVGFSQEKSIAELSTAPNPFTEFTTISYNSTISQTITLNVKNVLGRVVFTKKYDATNGKNSIKFYKNDLPSGIYIYIIQNSKNLISKRFVLK